MAGRSSPERLETAAKALLPHSVWRDRRGLAVAAVALLLVGLMIAVDDAAVLGVGLPLVALVALGLFKSPRGFVVGLLALRPLVDIAVKVELGGRSLGQLWGIAVLGAIAVYWIAEGFKTPLDGLSWFIPVCFAVAYGLTTVGRDPLGEIMPLAGKVVLFVVVMLTAEQIASNAGGQNTIARALLAMALCTLVAIGIALLRNDYGTAYYATTQHDSLAQGPHGLASLAVLTSSVVWLHAMGRTKTRWRWMLLAALLGVGVALSLVRTTYIAYAIVAAWFLAWSLFSRQKGAVGVSLGVVGIVGATLFAFRDQILGRVEDIGNLTAGGRADVMAGSGRIGIWRVIWETTTRHLSSILLGLGAGASTRLTIATVGQAVWAHNDFLEFFMTGGILLGGLYIAMVLWMFWSSARLGFEEHQCRRVREAGGLFAAVCVAFVVMAFFNGMMFYEASLAMAMLVGLARGMHVTPGRTFLDA